MVADLVSDCTFSFMSSSSFNSVSPESNHFKNEHKISGELFSLCYTPSSDYLCSFFKYTYLTVLFICFSFSKFEKYFCLIFHNNFLCLIRSEVFSPNSWYFLLQFPFQIFTNSVTNSIVMFTKFIQSFL